MTTLTTRPAALSTRRMAIDLFRDGDNYLLTADLPGIDPGSVDVDVDGRLLTISASRIAPAQENVTWLAQERQSGTFQRRLTLGDAIATDQITASYDNGVLSVIIPVSEKAKPRKIEVATA